MEEIIQKTKDYIDNNLMPLIIESNELLEGNIFMIHHTYEYTNIFLSKIKNIYTLSSLQTTKDVLEIGFNSGFSALLILLSNSNINLNCIDICQHKYTIPCFNKLKEDFGDRINFIQGNSVDVLNNISKLEKKYDMIHIDGSHEIDVANYDIINAYNLCKYNGILIMDDYNALELKQLWEKYVNLYNLKKIDLELYETDMHDIKVK